MKLSVLCLVVLAICFNARTRVIAQGTVADNAATVSSGLAEFSMEFLAKTADEGGEKINIILSTYSIWTLLAILNAGARGATSNQLMAALRIPSDDNVFRFGYKKIGDELMNITPGVEIDIANAIFTDRNKQLVREFQNIAATQYRVNFVPVNFKEIEQTATYIDSYIANVTRNRISNFINYDDLRDTQMLLTTAIFFKGQWSLPFNRSATFRDQFYDETMTRNLGEVMMMYQIGPYAYTKLSNSIKAHAIELPYGQDEKYSMVVILPMKNVLLRTILNQLTTVPLQSVIDDLERAKDVFYGEDVQVYLPRFSITSDYVMNVVLEKMGIWNVFDPSYADLQKISPDNIYLSRVIHKATIEVNEEGTVASAASGGTIAYKAPPPVFNATRPFAYFILEKTTKTVLFVGKFSNPNDA